MSSQMLAKRNSSSALMPPPPPPKRQKRPAKVLEEDVYSDAVSHIIARDFFPGLLETQVQTEYMEALDSENNDWIREAGRKLTHVMVPGPGGRRRGRGTSFIPRETTGKGETPRAYLRDIPGRIPLHSDPAPEEKPDVDVDMSLSAFQARYTSEDNESFNALLDKQNEKRSANYAFFYSGNKIPSARQIAHRAKEQKLLESRSSSGSNTLVTTNSAGEERTAVSLARPSQDLDVRSASVDSFPARQGARNHFMFGPEGVEDTTLTRAQQAEISSAAPPKAVKYSATRFGLSIPNPENTVPASPSLSAIDAAISGRPRETESEVGHNGVATPRVNGYAFVDAEPTPSEIGVPIDDDEADAAEREAANRLLPKVDESGPNHFQMSERSKREDLHYKLVDKANMGRRKGGKIEQLRNLGITPARTPTPRFSSAASVKGRGLMTPAAQRLAQSIGTPSREAGLFRPSDSQKKKPDPSTRSQEKIK